MLRRFASRKDTEEESSIMKKIILSLTILWLVTVLANFSRLNLYLGLFILAAAGERFWETFLLSKQNIFDKKSEFDWLFRIVSYYYILIMFGTVLEQLAIPKRLSPALVTTGAFIYLTALTLRLCAIRALGGSWNTCVLGKIKRRLIARRLIKKGPYQILRHPIYFGTILETLSLPLIFNSFYTLGFVILVYTPLIILRAHLEEKELFRIFGKGYLNYRAKTI